MPRSKKCPKCGLMQLARPQCKNCGAPLSADPSPSRSVALPESQPNPYAPPTQEARPSNVQGGLWQDGRLLLANRNAALPNRCVKCNQPTDHKMKRTYYWHPSGWYFLILLSVLIYVIVAMVVRKKAKIQVGLCERHRRRRIYSMAAGTLVPLCSIGGCIASEASDLGLALSLILVPFGLIWLAFASQLLRATRIDEQFVYLKGVHADYLATLPPLSEAYLR